MDRMIAKKTAEEIDASWPMDDDGTVDIIYMLEEKTEDDLYSTAEEIDRLCDENGSLNCVIAESGKEQKNILAVRSQMYEIFKPYFVDSLDTAVPMAHIGDLLRDIDAIAAKYGSTSPRVGHGYTGQNSISRIILENSCPGTPDRLDLRRSGSC